MVIRHPLLHFIYLSYMKEWLLIMINIIVDKEFMDKMKQSVK